MDRLPGFREFYPDPAPFSDGWSCGVRQHIFERWRASARRYGFVEYDGPPLESLELYTKKSGEEIVGQLYNFQDKGGRAVAMRPEMTPTAARMVSAAERHYKKPIKWFSAPQLFRYERQQKGRLREHFQLNCDLFGEPSPAADAEIIALLIDVLRDLGLQAKDFVIRLSSRQAWQRFFEQHGGKVDHAYSFYQIIDKLERERPEVSTSQLEELGISMAAVQEFLASGRPEPELETILDDLKARGLEDFVRVDYNVIRGLAYYTGVVFEAFDREGTFRAIAGGGRYDHLIHQVSEGKVDLPAVGFGMGDVVLTELLRERGCLPPPTHPTDFYVLIEEETLRTASLALIQRLRNKGWSVDYPLSAVKSAKQFKRAQELGASCTLRLEETTQNSDQATVWVKHLKTREEQRISLLDIEPTLQQLIDNPSS